MENQNTKMDKQNKISKNDLLMFGILVALIVFSRLIPHLPNLTAMGAVALGSGYYFRKSFLGVLVAPIALLLSDLIIGWYSMAPINYLSIVLVSLLGANLRKESKTDIDFSFTENGKSFLFASVMSSGVFFLISNFGVWIEEQLYPLTFSGLMNCYWMAIPFLRNELMGTLIYGSFILLVLRFFNEKNEAKSHA